MSLPSAIINFPFFWKSRHTRTDGRTDGRRLYAISGGTLSAMYGSQYAFLPDRENSFGAIPSREKSGILGLRVEGAVRFYNTIKGLTTWREGSILIVLENVIALMCL